MFLGHRLSNWNAQRARRERVEDGFQISYLTRRENIVFAGKRKPTAGTMPRMAIDQRVVGIHVRHYESDS